MPADKLQPSSIVERLSESEICPDPLLRGQEEAFQRDVERLQAQFEDFVTTACPACRQDDWQPAFEKWGFKYVTCRHCQTLYMNPRPSEAIMSDYYRNSENYRYWAEHIFPASEATRRDKINRPWLDCIVDYTDRFKVARDVLLEVGPGFGTFSALATQSGQFKTVIAVEPTPEMAQACRERHVHVIEKRIEDIQDEIDELADVAVAFEVIEHLFEPRQFVEQCARLLKPGGMLVLSCPNGQGFDISVLGPVSLAIDPEHVNLYNPKSLSLLLESCEFEVLEVSTPGRLDVEFVHTAIKEGKFDVSDRPFLRRVLYDEWDRLGWPFQQFLAENGLSSHMWLAARKNKDAR